MDQDEYDREPPVTGGFGDSGLMNHENPPGHDSQADMRQKLVRLYREEGWEFGAFMIAMSSIVTDALKQGHTPSEWTREELRYKRDRRREQAESDE